VRNRQHRKLPLPRSFKPERREHWLDRHEREVDEHEELLRKLVPETKTANKRRLMDVRNMQETALPRAPFQLPDG
jgi:hypothetical protein